MSTPLPPEAPVITVGDFRVRYPEFAANDDTQVSAALDDALPWNGYDAWGASYTQGVCTLAAHLLALSNQRAQSAAAAGGGLATGIFRYATSRRAGALGVTYGSVGAAASGSGGPGQIPAFLALTTYGVEWYAMARIKGMGAVALNADPTDDMTGVDITDPPYDAWSFFDR